MARIKHVNMDIEAVVRLEDGGHGTITAEDVILAAYVTEENPRYDVLVTINNKTVPVKTLVREALGGHQPHGTNDAEMALHQLGFTILTVRRFDKRTGQPVRLTLEQIKNSEI